MVVLKHIIVNETSIYLHNRICHADFCKPHYVKILNSLLNEVTVTQTVVNG